MYFEFSLHGKMSRMQMLKNTLKKPQLFSSLLSDPEADNRVVILLGILQISCVKNGMRTCISIS